MKYNLELREEAGWILNTDESIEKCVKCHKKLIPPFFLCRTTEKAYHPKCEKGIFKCARFDKDYEHYHFNIIDIKIK